MGFFEFTSQNGSQYELSQPEWLWLIPVILGINFILKLYIPKYIIKSTPASLSEMSDKQRLFHPLFNKLNIEQSLIKLIKQLGVLKRLF